ncbi:hypothetical protein C455_09633 [Haloferax larsenii JCM 13917]|nr:hypothetical protein C455_09633 [Haloferax larsenii JCM 13917]
MWLNTRSGSIEIGDKVMIGRNVQLITGTHDFNKTGRERIETVPTEGRDIIIHDGAWISWGVDVIGPCEIGENTVISAGSVVIDDCEANAIYAGNPAKKVSEIDIE